MLSTGLLADGAREYSETFNRRWLVTSYEAGDVVLHNPFAVSSNVSTCRKQPPGNMQEYAGLLANGLLTGSEDLQGGFETTGSLRISEQQLSAGSRSIRQRLTILRFMLQQ